MGDIFYNIKKKINDLYKPKVFYDKPKKSIEEKASLTNRSWRQKASGTFRSDSLDSYESMEKDESAQKAAEMLQEMIAKDSRLAIE